MGRFIIILTICFFSVFPSELRAQECFEQTKCEEDGETKRAEVVPQTHLARCEDYKAKARAVPGLIIAERRSLIAASECEAALTIFRSQLTDKNIELGKERELRIRAEKRAWTYGILGVVSGVVVTLVSVFIVREI